jgi:hypothetical protein
MTEAETIEVPGWTDSWVVIIFRGERFPNEKAGRILVPRRTAE